METLNYKGFGRYLKHSDVFLRGSVYIFEFRNNITLRFCRGCDDPKGFWGVIVSSHGKRVSAGYCQSKESRRLLRWARKLKDEGSENDEQ